MPLANFLYIVPGHKFFSQGFRGRVAHAVGICEGLSLLDYGVVAIGGPGLGEHIKRFNINTEYSEISCADLKSPFLRLKWFFELFIKSIHAIRQRNFTHIVIRYSFSSIPLYIAIALMTPKRRTLVLEVNSFLFNAYFTKFALLNVLLARIEIAVSSLFDYVYFASSSIQESPQCIPLRSKSLVIPNGASERFPCVASLHRSGIVNTVPRLVYLGTLMHYYNFEFLTRAINLVSQSIDFQFHLFGDGPAKNIFEGLERSVYTEFHGAFDRFTVSQLMRPDDILVLPPQTLQMQKVTGGLSTKIFDYMSLRLPILAPLQKETESIFRNEENCLIYSPNSIDSFAKCFTQLFLDQALRLRLSHAAYYDFRHNFSWRSRMSKLLELIAPL